MKIYNALLITALITSVCSAEEPKTVIETPVIPKKPPKTLGILILCMMSMVTLPTDAKPPKALRTGKVSQKEQYADSIPKPTLSEVAYGSHERNVLDFWKAKSEKPTPLAFVIHGGGWKNGSKERLSRFVDAPALLNAGISVVAINYRLIKSNSELQPPVRKLPCMMRPVPSSLLGVRQRNGILIKPVLQLRGVPQVPVPACGCFTMTI